MHNIQIIIIELQKQLIESVIFRIIFLYFLRLILKKKICHKILAIYYSNLNILCNQTENENQRR